MRGRRCNRQPSSRIEIVSQWHRHPVLTRLLRGRYLESSIDIHCDYIRKKSRDQLAHQFLLNCLSSQSHGEDLWHYTFSITCVGLISNSNASERITCFRSPKSVDNYCDANVNRVDSTRVIANCFTTVFKSYVHCTIRHTSASWTAFFLR